MNHQVCHKVDTKKKTHKTPQNSCKQPSVAQISRDFNNSGCTSLKLVALLACSKEGPGFKSIRCFSPDIFASKNMTLGLLDLSLN